MDFDMAAKRLARDHSKLKLDAASRQRGKTLGLSRQVREEAEARQIRARQRVEERQGRERELAYHMQCFRDCERSLKVERLTSGESGGFQATSIHGEGDKLTLPPSVLEYLSSLTGTFSPWTFRIGILNPDYAFPASSLLFQMKSGNDDDSVQNINSDDEDNNDSTNHAQWAAYVDELHHKYLAYTHGSVLEFTQEEGYVGLPLPLVTSLLSQTNHPTFLTKRTIDPSTSSNFSTSCASHVHSDERKTAGHLAWGSFDLPAMPVEVSIVQLPQAKGCTLVPTSQAIQNGFYYLKDIKLVLEQSLIRTRSTLSVGDFVHTWNRGIQYDLFVTAVVPSNYGSVMCINTDIEVEFGHLPVSSKTGNKERGEQSPPFSQNGRTLLDPTSMSTNIHSPLSTQRKLNLLPEPPCDQSDDVCVVQMRLGNRSSGKRRFDIRKARVSDLYDYCESEFDVYDRSSIRLVSRFPRRVIVGAATLAEIGITPGQELIIVEIV